MTQLDTEKSPLVAEFLKDHQQFSRLLYQIEKSLSQNDMETAVRLAKELNLLAGSHIAFEERELYPRLNLLGEKRVTESQLVAQHHDAVDALRELLALEGGDDSAVEKIKAGFSRALGHAEHCGSLISLMVQLDESQQAEALAVLLELRESGIRWTELTSSGSGH